MGNGQRDASDSVDYVEPEFEETDGGDVDEFQEVTGPDQETEPQHGEQLNAE